MSDPSDYEFDCIDCKAHVFVVGYMPSRRPARCGTCQWIMDYVPEHERDAVRKRLHVEVIEP
jgi:hypothetical protein